MKWRINDGLILPDGQSCEWYARFTHCLSIRMCSDCESPRRVRRGWRRLRGCLELQVIFRKRATNHSQKSHQFLVLRKMTCKDTASYDSTPPCRNAARPCRVTLDVSCAPRHVNQNPLTHSVSILRMIRIIRCEQYAGLPCHSAIIGLFCKRALSKRLHSANNMQDCRCGWNTGLTYHSQERWTYHSCERQMCDFRM